MTITEAYSVFEKQELYKRAEKTKRNYRSAINSLTGAVGDVPILIINKQTIACWDANMMRSGDTGTTRAGYLSCLRQILKFFRGEDYQMNVMHPAEIERPNRDTKPKAWLLPEEGRMMLEAAKKPRDKALIAVLWETGARISEVLSLDRSDLEKETIPLCGKAGKWNDVTLGAGTRAIIEQYLATRNDNYPPIFLSSQRRRMTVSRAEQIVHEIQYEAGIEYKNVTPHTFRHSYATDQLSNGAPVKEVSEQLGHSKVSTTLNTYHHILPTQKWEAKRKYHTSIV